MKRKKQKPFSKNWFAKASKHPCFLIAADALALFLLSPPARLFYSVCIMGVYSKMNEKESLIATEQIDIRIPGGLSTPASDWYPFVMNFCADAGFQSYTGNRNLSLTILYNFPAFSLLRGSSRLYDATSPYYNSFYGAYLIKDATGQPFGWTKENGRLIPDSDQIALVPRYDFFRLVLSEFGLTQENAVFDWNITSLTENVEYAEWSGFTRMDAELTVNGSAHIASGFTQSYLQYGPPRFSCETPLAPVQMYGRLYGIYLQDRQVSLFFYIVAADRDVLEECDKKILSKSRLSL